MIHASNILRSKFSSTLRTLYCNKTLVVCYYFVQEEYKIIYNMYICIGKIQCTAALVI